MRRIACLLLALLLALPCAALGTDNPLQVTVTPHRVDFSCDLAGQEAIYVTCAAAGDTCRQVFWGDNGRFEGGFDLQGTDTEARFSVTVTTLSGRQLLQYVGMTAADDSGKGPASGLVKPEVTAGSAREAEYSCEADGVHYRFVVPGRAALIVRCKSPQETHEVTVYAGADWWYEGVVAMPCSFQDDTVTVTVMDANSRAELGTASLRMPCAAPEAAPQAETGRLSGVTVCIDPGHQRQTQVETVLLAPNFTKTTTTTVGMAQGVVTRRRESIVVLEIGFLLRDALLAEGATVIMTRESQDVFVGMLERADIPNDAGADFVLRLHCNSRDNESAQGIQIYCPYESSYAREVADEDTYRQMGFTLLYAMQEATGAQKGSCTLNNTYVGNNWSKMPSFLVEMGYMSNKEEDLKLSSPAYQAKLVQGMVEGVVQLSVMRGLITEQE
ncbi:MAG: N-acetylmuramoyl-L-alanine amidase [Clostridia bacterium]|nr:N-acetylmuramoyl-L-alanine amidase [Clostridia bacterium]